MTCRISSKNVCSRLSFSPLSVGMIGMISLVMGLEVLMLFCGYSTCSTVCVLMTRLWFYICNIAGPSLHFFLSVKTCICSDEHSY